MTDRIELYGFGYDDRSGKVRWAANELGIEIDEHKIALGDNRQSEYRAVNPFGSIPAVVYKGETLYESTATIIYLAELYPDKGLAVFSKEAERYKYLKWLSLCAESFEGRLVDVILTKFGLMPEELKAIYEKSLNFKCSALVNELPTTGFLVADRLTVADIVCSYTLKLGILTGFIAWEDVQGYLEPLIKRPAAQASHFFESLNKALDDQ